MLPRIFVKHDITATLRAFMHYGLRRQHADHVVAFAVPVYGLCQVHQTAAFRIGGQSGFDGVADRFAQASIGR